VLASSAARIELLRSQHVPAEGKLVVPSLDDALEVRLHVAATRVGEIYSPI
jgi:hypothetical protein